MSKLKTGLIALLAVMTTFMIIGVTTAYAFNIEENTMCYGYSNSTLSPLGITSAFLTTNEEAGIWLKISNPPNQVTFKFYYTENNIEKEFTGGYSKVDVIDKAGTNWGIAFSTMDINGKTPEFKPGFWTAKAFIDGEEAAIIKFNVINYPDLSSQISQISENVQDIVDEKNSLLADYETVVEDYDDIVTQYEELKESTVSEIQLNNLNNDYDDLQEEYEDLQDAQEGTQSMMYASIVVALVAVVIAVYFGVMKK